MSAPLKRMKQNDRADPLIAELVYRNTELDLTDTITVATPAVFIMTPEGSSTPTINRATATVASATDSTVTVRYDWASGETATVGRYRGEFEFTLAGGAVTAPTNGYITIDILDDLG
jgi:hypothetical protein